MPLSECISEIVAAGGGRIDDAEAERMLNAVVDRARRYERRMSRAEAAIKAGRDLANEAKIAAAYTRRDAALNALINDNLHARATPGREAQVVRELPDLIYAAGNANAARLQGGLNADLREAGLLKAVLQRNKLFERDIGREMWRITDPASGPPTGNLIAKQVAEIYHRWNETSRVEQNAAGARIGKEEHYVVRQSHDMEKIRGVGWKGLKDSTRSFQEWHDFILPLLDERTFDGVDNRETFLGNVWENLASGIHETSQGGTGFLGPGNLGKKISAERVLHFKNADAWIDYNERFGRGNITDSVLRGLELAGRNTALMRNLGTNPEFMFNAWRSSLAEQAAARHDFNTSDALRSKRTQQLMDIVTGKAAIPDNMTIAWYGRLLRVIQSLAKLGGVVLSSLPDLAVNAATLRHSGVPLFEAYTNQVLSLLQGRRSGETRLTADLLGVGINGMIGRLLSRFSGEEHFGTASKLVELFHRANFLSWWTDSLKTGVGLMLSHNLARRAGSAFDALPRRLQNTLRRYGIEAAEWDAIRQTNQRAADGKMYVMPGEVQNLPDSAVAHLTKTGSAAEIQRVRDDLQSKLGAYITDTTAEAMTEPRASDRLSARLGMQAIPGTWGGEAIGLLMQFKQYPITFTRRTIERELRRDGVDVMGIAHLLVATTLLGYVSMTLKEYAKGRNRRKPEDLGGYAKLVMAAFVQGGGLGLYGDFLFGEANRMGGGMVESFIGPTFGTLGEVERLIKAIRDGSDSKTRGELAASHGLQLLKNNTPFLNLFYTRAALDYFVLYRLQEAMNPGYLRRYEKKVKKENNQTFWLRPTAAVR